MNTSFFIIYILLTTFCSLGSNLPYVLNHVLNIYYNPEDLIIAWITFCLFVIAGFIIAKTDGLLWSKIAY